MSIWTVKIVPAEEAYTPPEKMIELAVVGDGPDHVVRVQNEDGTPGDWGAIKEPRQLVLLSLSAYDETSDGTTYKREMEFPAIDLNDLLRALASFGVGVQSWHAGPPPLRVAMPRPEEPKAE